MACGLPVSFCQVSGSTRSFSLPSGPAVVELERVVPGAAAGEEEVPAGLAGDAAHDATTSASVELGDARLEPGVARERVERLARVVARAPSSTRRPRDPSGSRGRGTGRRPRCRGGSRARSSAGRPAAAGRARRGRRRPRGGEEAEGESQANLRGDMGAPRGGEGAKSSRPGPDPPGAGTKGNRAPRGAPCRRRGCRLTRTCAARRSPTGWCR